MTWSLEVNLMIVCVIVLIAQIVSKLTGARIPAVFLTGLTFMFLFIGKVIPKDFIEVSGMQLVGNMCISMLIINMGTTFDLDQIKREWKTVVICLITCLLLVVIVGFGLRPVVGKEIALISPGPIAGGGAAAAVVSREIVRIKPQLAAYPWLIFMMQGLIGFPLCSWAMRKAMKKNLAMLREGTFKIPGQQVLATNKKLKLCDRIPKDYKTTAYYWSYLLVLSVFNLWLQHAFLGRLRINTNITAVIIGILVGSLGLVDRGGLAKSDSMGMLFLGLYGLMASSFAGISWKQLLSMVTPLLIVFAISTVIMIVTGILGAKLFKMSRYRGIAISINCYVGFPYNFLLCKEAIAALTDDPKERQILEDDMMPTMVTASLISVTLVSVLVAGFMVTFL